MKLKPFHSLPGWRGIYILGFALYFAVYVIVTLVGGLRGREVLVFPFAATLPPALLGLLVVRYYRVRRAPWHFLRHFLFGLGFAISSVLGSTLILFLAYPTTMKFRVDSMMWALLIAGLVFVIVASGAHADQTHADLVMERERAVQAEASRARAELAALRARVDPHFLFNTLHSLLALVRQDPGRAEEAIQQFADILRYTFGAADGGDERTLRQEWELVDNYLALERLRLGKRLRLDATLEDEVAGCPLPVLTLQPLVENAIRHAIAPRAAGGRLEISARRVEERVRISVCDDGPGIQIRPRGSPQGQGLELVRERLEHMYANDARLELGTSSAGGLRVTISLPWRA